MKNKIYKALSVLLAMAIMLSVCVCAIGSVSAATATYYVSATGDDLAAGTSVETAVASYAKAIELANTNYGTGDTVTVKLTGDSVEMGTIPEYAYDLVVEGMDAVATKLSTTSSKGAVANNPNGKTVLRNIQLVSTQSYPSFALSGSKEVVFESTASGFTATQYAMLGTYNDGGAATTIGGQTVTFNCSVGTVYLGNAGWQSKTVTSDHNIILAGGGSPTILFNPSTNSKLTLKKNLNLNIKSASSVSFSNKGGTVTVEGAVQIINSTGAAVTSTNSILAAIDCDKYVVTNSTGKADIIEFTETAGKFKVDTTATKFDIIATDTEGNVTKADQNGYLTLPKTGDYELSLYRDPIDAVYFVSAAGSGTEGDGTKEKPFLTVFDAINKGIEDGLTNKDTLTVKLLGEETIQWGDVQRTPEYTFKLIVESYDRNNYSKVNILQTTYLGGYTHLRYGIYVIDNLYSQIRINNKEFIIDDTAHFSCLYFTFGDNSTSNTIPGHRVVFNNPISSTHINLSNNLHSNSKKYSGDLEVVVNNSNAAPILRLGGEAGIVYYKANVNLNVKEARRISFSADKNGKNVCEGAIQLIANSKTQVDEDGLDYLKTTCNPAKGFYYIINTSDYKEAIEFTATEGKYAVDTDLYNVTAVGENGTFVAENGFLTVDGAGEYTLIVTKKAEEIDTTIYEKLDNATLNLWEKEGEVVIDNAQSVATIDFGDKTYNDVKISIINAQKITFTGTPTVNGVLEIVVNGQTQVASKEVIDSITVGRGKWYITNNSGCKAVFGDEDGELVYAASGKELEAVAGQTVIMPKFENFLLNEGEYEIRVRAKEGDKYDQFIDYRGNNLSNTYAKIKNGEKLNVVYYGGSVTNGSGASESNVTSWRGRVGQWLKNTYTDTEIFNINSAIGATGSVYGTYRLDRHVLEEEPDLFFIEFSINDYLDWHHSGKDYRKIASQHMETIIRRVRTEYPDCDIVMLHTTDRAVGAKMFAGVYYDEAQAHHDIAKAYNISTINVGGALVTAMGENWNSDAVWSQYVTDTVHPNDKGYQIYFDVIREFLVNSLIYGENSTEVKNHEMPAMVNEKLIDGDLSHYDVTQELLAKSEALGGSGFVYSPGEKYSATEFGCVISSDTDSVFAFEFEGTELAMVAADGNHTGYMVKIDDGEYYSVAKGGLTKPVFLATELSPGKHTAYIMQKDASVTIKLISLYSRDETKATVKEVEHTFTNYVPNNDATCQKNGTETAVCDCGCGEQDTRDIPNSKVDHKYTDATDTTCDFGCGYTRVLGKQLVEEGGEKYYYNNGVKQVEVTDLVWIDGVWYYIEEGRWASDIDTLHKINGKWFLVKGGIWNKTTGLEEYKGKTFYVSGGKWDASVTDLKKVDGVWYYIQYGKWNNTIDTLHKINGKWFLIKKGIWNKTTGLVDYKGKTFYVSGGKWNSSVNTLYKKGSKYYAIKSGKLYEGKTIITYNGKKFYCNKGYAQLSFSGKVKIGTKTYTIKAGKVV